jgi:hypothetical protein
MSDSPAPASPLQTRIHALLDQRPFGDPWLADLWQHAAGTRPGIASRQPRPIGDLLVGDAPAEHAARAGTVFDRALAPPSAFLRWLLEHPEEMTVGDPDTFGAKSPEVRAWRKRLFGGQAADVSMAKSEGLRQLSSRLAQRGRNKWWLFEGFARVDACFVTDSTVLILDRWRDDLLASSSRWYPDRAQIWRNLEATREFAGSRAFGLILVVDDEAQGHAALVSVDECLSASYPHLVFEEQEKLERHLLGYITESGFQSISGIPPLAP